MPLLSLKKTTITLSFLTLLAILFLYQPKFFLMLLAYLLTALYLIWGVYHVVITLRGLSPPLSPVEKLKLYPKLSIIIPARDEPILGRSVETVLEHTDYPKDLKEVVIVTDDPEGERIGIWYQQIYPYNVKLLARRQFFPTKPSALNDAIAICSGEIIGIMDVEDIPDKDVFLKAISALTNHGYDAVQVILRIVNENDSWITKCFAIEYAAWFRIWLNGRSKLGLYTPLGGTGNYFKRSAVSYVGGWDPTNLAEDAEVAIRMTLAGMRIGVINARHWEEAPVTLKAWLRQRTRWYRGWLQSLWNYLRLFTKRWALKKYGFTNLATLFLMLINPVIVFVNLIAYSITIIWILEFLGLLPPLVSTTVPFWAFITAGINVLYYYAWFKGAELEKVTVNRLRILPYLIFYLNIMLPIAALRALYQQLFQPVFWEKTQHPGRGVRWHIIERG